MTRLALLLTLLASPALAEPSIQVAFSPSGGATEAVIQAISEARFSVHLAAYGFTSKPIAHALIDAKKRGVDVQVVLDKSNAAARYTQAQELAQAGILVRIDYRYAIMHSKYLVIDGETVECGSFNYTQAAELHNAENVIVLRDYPGAAARYEANWKSLWDESDPYQGGEAP